MSEINEYVLFKIANEYYGIDIKYVENIEKPASITRVPYTESYIKGVINLRGIITPVIDVRERLSLEPKETTNESRIIITSLDEERVGLIVDSSAEVIRMDTDSIEKAPSVGDKVKNDYVTNVGKDQERLILLVDLKKLLGIEGDDPIDEKRAFNVTGTELGDKIKEIRNLRKLANELFIEFREEKGIDTDLFRIVGDYPPNRAANKEDSYDIWLYIHPTEKDKVKFKDQLQTVEVEDEDLMSFKPTSDIGISFKEKCEGEGLVTTILNPNIRKYFNKPLGPFKCTFEYIEDDDEQHILLEGKNLPKDEIPEDFIEITN